MSPESRELLVAAETADPLDLWDPLASLDLQESLAERSESGQHTACVCGWIDICHIVFSLFIFNGRNCRISV